MKKSYKWLLTLIIGIILSYYATENYSDFRSDTSLYEYNPSSEIVDVIEKFVEG